MKKVLLSTVTVLLLSASINADANIQTGCGLGSQVLKDADSAVMYALQATTNGTSANQTFGITSGTSGCKKAQFVMNERASEFVASNMDILAKEIALGYGESIYTLAELLSVEDKVTFASLLQSNYNSIYTSQDVQMSDVLDNISTTI